MKHTNKNINLICFKKTLLRIVSTKSVNSGYLLWFFKETWRMVFSSVVNNWSRQVWQFSKGPILPASATLNKTGSILFCSLEKLTKWNVNKWRFHSSTDHKLLISVVCCLPGWRGVWESVKYCFFLIFLI